MILAKIYETVDILVTVVSDFADSTLFSMSLLYQDFWEFVLFQIIRRLQNPHKLQFLDFLNWLHLYVKRINA